MTSDHRKILTLRAVIAVLILTFPITVFSQAKEGENGFLPPKAVQVSGVNIKVAGGPMSKLSGDLADLYKEHGVYQNKGGLRVLGAFKPSNGLLHVRDGYVAIEAVASANPGVLRIELEAMGMKDGATFGYLVSGWLPISAVDDMASLQSLQFSRCVYAETNSGLVSSQGDVAMLADAARASFAIDGTGVMVGVLSDSYDCLGSAASDEGNGDLPPGINVLDDSACPNGTDEGRAMMQIIHDVAPGAAQAFHTAFAGQANFAQGIIDLANDGARVIVDDVIYFAEPMFQDGIVAQAVNTVADSGVPYFSSAGNQARNSYESPFRPSGIINPAIGGIQLSGEAHDFDPGPGVDIYQNITIPMGRTLIMSFQWDSPFFSVNPRSGGSPNDLDILLVSGDLGNVVASSLDSNVGGDPVEIMGYTNVTGATSFNIVILNYSGPDPMLLKYIMFRSLAINEFDTKSSTILGHANAQGAEAVGAAFYASTPEFGVDPPVLESFSSAGSTLIFFDEAGNRLPNPESRMKPEIVAPDGTNTTFFGTDVDSDGWPNFFGTSAAAPHAAALAVLILEASPTLLPANLYRALEDTAIDMGETGFDLNSGYGFVQAEPAIRFLANKLVVLREKTNNSFKLQVYFMPNTLGGRTRPPIANDNSFWRYITAISAVDFDSDPEGELAVIRQLSNGLHRLQIYDLPTTVDGETGPPVATDDNIGRDVVAISAVNFGDDLEEELAVVRLRSDGAMRLEIYDLPSTVDGDTGPPIASDNSFWRYITAISAVNFDNDPEDELAVIRQLSNGLHRLQIYDLPTTVGGETGPPIASYNSIGSDVVGIAAVSFDNDPEDELVVVGKKPNGGYNLLVYELPATLGSDTGVPLASDKGIGKNISAIAVVK